MNDMVRLVAGALLIFGAPIASAVPVSFDGGNQAPTAPDAAFNPTLLYTPAPTAVGGYEIFDSSAQSITYDFTPGAGRYTTNLLNTQGVVGSPIPVSTTYNIIQYATVGSGGGWTGWYAGMSQCCWQVRGVDVIDASTNAPVSGLSFVNNAADRSVTYTFDALAAGTILEIHNTMIYTMPIPLVTDGTKLFHAAPIVSAVPVPAAVWLFGSAVGLLGCLRRRGG